MSNASTIRTEITEQIVKALEGGTIPWRRPWRSSPNAGRPLNVVSKRPYSGINTLLLQLHEMKFSLTSKWFGTFDQWKELGGAVKARPKDVEPGHWGCKIVFYRPLSKTVTEKDTGEEHEEKYLLLKTYTVFSVDQVEGTALDRFRANLDLPGNAQPAPDYEKVENLIRASGADIRIGGDRACYALPQPEGSWPKHTAGDFIQMPPRGTFGRLGAYYETLLHELAHFCEPRLAWDRKAHGYAMCELVAEMSACMLAAELGVPDGEDLKNHAAYLSEWLKTMQGDASFIFKAATQASKVTDYLLGLVPEKVEEAAAA
jgi:antirestriction protein ArdC